MTYFNDDEPVDGFSDSNAQAQHSETREEFPNPPDRLTSGAQDPLSPDEAEELREEAGHTHGQGGGSNG